MVLIGNSAFAILNLVAYFEFRSNPTTPRESNAQTPREVSPVLSDAQVEENVLAARGAMAALSA